jgi:hypothetical protein
MLLALRVPSVQVRFISAVTPPLSRIVSLGDRATDYGDAHQVSGLVLEADAELVALWWIVVAM